MSAKSLYARTVRPGLACVFVGVLVVTLSGCNAAPPPEPATITFAYRDLDTEYFEGVVHEFNEQYPHITIELRPLTASGLRHLEAGGADVRMVWQVILSDLQEQGDIMSLEPFIEADASFDRPDFSSAALDAFTVEGRIWAIPHGTNPIVIYYNKDLFDQYEVSYPEVGWTWDDFLSAALAIRDPDAGVFGYASDVEPYDALWLIYQHGGQVFDDIQNPTRTTFDDPLTIEAMEWYAELYHRHNVAPLPQEWREIGGNEGGILTGKVGMWSYYFAFQGGRDFFMEWPMRWGMVTLPRDTHAVTSGICGAFAISSQTQYPDAAWQWISFASRQPHHYTVPVRRSVAGSAEYEQLVGSDVAIVARECLETGLFDSPRVFTVFGGALDAFEAAVEGIISGDWTAQEAMDWAQREARARVGP
jgi:multiple sugar transport system substrate-binding protein